MNMKLIPATLEDHPIIEKMWPFYVYDMSRGCGFNKGWESPTDLTFIPDDLTPYFNDPDKKVFIIKVDNEFAGFVLLNNREISEFFIIAKFQGKGLGKIVAEEIWHMSPGIWRVPVIPENKQALVFWRNVIAEYTTGNYKEEETIVNHNTEQVKRVIFTFSTGYEIKA